MAIVYIDEKIMEIICHRLAVQFFHKDGEPIAPYRTCNTVLLDSALNLPRATFDGKELYPTLIDKAGVLYYSLIKNHAFENGNKRIATAALFVFLWLNNYWPFGSTGELTQKAIEVAESEASEREVVIESIKTFLRDRIRAVDDYPESYE